MNYLKDIIDFHSHILPEIDDGSSSAEESVQMLSKMYKQGVRLVLATPHFYDVHTNVDTFLEKRSKSHKLLMEKINEQNICFPEIKLAAEVHFSYEILDDPQLEFLCVENSRCILIEMPYGIWYDWMYEGINKIATERNLIPVLAHLERYVNFPGGLEQIKKMLELDVYAQINADSFLKKRYNKVISQLFQMNKIHLIGSDTHDIKNRPCKIDRAREKIISKFGENTWINTQENALRLLKLQ